MSLVHIHAADALTRLDEFHTVIDARSESEYVEDHLPGAVNWPSLNDAQRHAIGTEYKQVSPFEARKRGAALAARNIAGHIEQYVLDKPRHWQPLVYCWRGGKRSGSLALVLDQIGFPVHLLVGGYREYRRAVVSALESLPQNVSLRVICGTTGSGKSRLLQLLARQGHQVLDLETLANHRGSVLGLLPGQRQPSQKQFESRVWDALRRFNPARPVWVESESKKVGDVQVPPALIQHMRAAPCVHLDLSLDGRVQLLLDEYRHFVDDTAAFCTRLDALRVLRGHEQVDRWQASARAGDTEWVVRELLVLHYDPIYLRSMQRNFAGFAAPAAGATWDGSDASLLDAAHTLASMV
jgi:tRNA 2-selenouridine synthase